MGHRLKHLEGLVTGNQNLTGYMKNPSVKVKRTHLHRAIRLSGPPWREGLADENRHWINGE